MVFCAALALRLIAVFALGELPISRTPQLDSAAYVSWARALIDDPAFWPAYPEHAPGYPMFVAAVLAVTGGSLMAVRIVQSIFGAIGCVLTARIASRTLTPKAFLPAGLLQAVYAPLIYTDSALLAESLFVFLLIVALDLATSAATRRRWLIGGIVLGLAIVVRPTAFVLLPAFAIVIVRQVTRQTAIRFASGLAAGVLLVVTPVVIQNWRVTGIPMVQAYGGMNFYLGNRPAGNGMASARPGGEWDALEGEASRAGADRNDQDAHYIRKAFSEMAEQPGQYVRLIASKLVWTAQDEELRDTHSYYFFEHELPLLRRLPGFGVIAALAVVGGIVSRRANQMWLCAYIAAMLLTVIFLVVGTRYRLPMVPAVIAVAGAGIAGIIELIWSRQWRNVAALIAVFVVMVAVFNVWTDAASRDLAEEYALTGLSLLQENKVEDAEAAYRIAIGQGESSFAWDGLGLVLLRRKMRTDALEAFQRAVDINEKNATAWMHLGLTYEFLGNRQSALEAYRTALRITPQRAEAKQLLQDALLRR